MKPEELDERIQHMAHEIARAYRTEAPFMAIDPFVRDLIRKSIEAVTPEKLTKDENRDLLWDDFDVGYQRGFNMSHEVIEQNTKELLG